MLMQTIIVCAQTTHNTICDVWHPGTQRLSDIVVYGYWNIIIYVSIRQLATSGTDVAGSFVT